MAFTTRGTGPTKETGTIFCPVDAPYADTAASVHREANGVVADQI
jgi:hypothetical protein